MSQYDRSHYIRIGNDDAYTVLFTELCPPALPLPMPCPVIDITITRNCELSSYISYSVLRQFSDIIHKYLNDNDVVLFYLCDSSEIKRRRSNISPQAYRNALFSALADRKRDKSIFKQDIALIDRSMGYDVDYYATVIANSQQKEAVITLSSAITAMEK
jgi:hypothetical protein